MPTPPKATAKKSSLAALKILADEGKKVAELATASKLKTTRLIAASNVTKKLSALVRAGKMSPAEFRKADVKKLSAASAEVLDAYASAFEHREPVIQVGQAGTRDAVDAVELAQESKRERFAALKAEAQEAIAMKTGKKVSKLKGAAKLKPMNINDRVQAKLSSAVAEQTKSLAEQVPEKDSRLSDSVSADSPPEEFQAHMQQQQEQIDALTVQLAKMGDVIRQMAEAAEAEDQADEQLGQEDSDDAEMGADEEEKDELAGDEDGDADLAADDKDDDKKELADEEDDEKKKGEKKLARVKAPAKPKKTK